MNWSSAHYVYPQQFFSFDLSCMCENMVNIFLLQNINLNLGVMEGGGHGVVCPL